MVSEFGWKRSAVQLILLEAMILLAHAEYQWLCLHGYREFFPSFFVSWEAQFIVPGVLVGLFLFRHHLRPRTASLAVFFCGCLSFLACFEVLLSLHRIAAALSPSTFEMRFSP